MRILNRFLSVLLAIVLIVVGVWAITTSLVRATGVHGLPAVYDVATTAVQRAAVSLRIMSLSDPVALRLSTGLVVIGLLLGAAEVWPRLPRRVKLGQPLDVVTWWADRGSVERGLSRMLVARTSATRARTWLRPRRAVWQVTIRAEAPPDAKQELEEQASLALAKLGQPADQVVLRLRIERTPRVA